MIIRKLMPSTPKAYSAPIEGIHSARSTNLKTSPGVSLGNQKSNGSETKKPRSVKAFPSRRTVFFFSEFTSAIGNTPRSGVKRIMVSKCSR